MPTTITRFPALTPESASGRAAERLGDLWHRHDGQVSEMVRTMAGSSALLAGYLDLSRAMKRSRIERRTSELISIAVQARLRCGRCLEAHIAAAFDAGADDLDVALAVGGTARDGAVAALIGFALAVHGDPASVDDRMVADLRSHGHRDRDLLDVIGLVCLNHLTGAFNLVAGLEPEEPMNTTTRLAAFGGILAAVFAGASGVGLAAGPIDTGGAVTHEQPLGHDDDQDVAVLDDAGHRAGTSLDEDGMRLAPEFVVVGADRPIDYSFRLLDEHGETVTDFVARHERELHLIVASRDLLTYHHLHPGRDAAGTWTVDLPPLAPGTYRVFADAQPAAADPVTLGVDLLVVDGGAAGGPPATATVDTVHGFEVRLSGDPRVGGAALSFTVERDGAAVATDPYLGAAGHLVVLRSGDLTYVHAHAEQAGDDHSILFEVAFPTAGTYRLFLDFSIDGVVHTADFTVTVPESGAPMTPTSHGGH